MSGTGVAVGRVSAGRTTVTLRELRREALLAVLDREGPRSLAELHEHPLTGRWPRVQLAVAVGDLVVAGQVHVDADGRLWLGGPREC